MELSDLIIPASLVILGAYAVDRLFTGYSPNTCTGPTSQTCIGPICWSTCTSSSGAAGAVTGPAAATTGPQGTSSYFYPWMALNVGLPAGPGNSPVVCGPTSWITDWDNCGFGW